MFKSTSYILGIKQGFLNLPSSQNCWIERFSKLVGENFFKKSRPQWKNLFLDFRKKNHNYGFDFMKNSN